MSWARVVAQFERSGESQAAFCEAHGLNLGTFRGWLYRLRKDEERQHPGFVEVMTAAVATRAGCIVRFGDTEVHFDPVPEPGYLAALLEELSEREP